jgi:hypothetical protein
MRSSNLGRHSSHNTPTTRNECLLFPRASVSRAERVRLQHSATKDHSLRSAPLFGTPCSMAGSRVSVRTSLRPVFRPFNTAPHHSASPSRVLRTPAGLRSGRSGLTRRVLGRPHGAPGLHSSVSHYVRPDGASNVRSSCALQFRRSPCDGRPTGAARTAPDRSRSPAPPSRRGSYLTPATWR